MELERIQNELRKGGLDGWLFYDFHNRDAIAYRVLGLDFGKFTSRRWFYFIPARGEPAGLVHKVEPSKLDKLPGDKRLYLGWQELHRLLPELLGSAKRVAMQFSPEAAIPYVSAVDGGTIDLVRRAGCQVVSSADLVQLFEAVIDESGYRSHVEAGEKIQRIKNEAFAHIGERVRSGAPLSEYQLQRWIVSRFEEQGLTCDNEPPIVGINDHPANPHFEPTAANSYQFKPGDKVLIDLWAKLDRPGSIFYDITWCGYVGAAPAAKHAEIFAIVRNAREEALRFVRERFASGAPVHGYEVDDACRRVVREAGYGEFFVHRTGHSIGQNVHGNGVHLDNLETKDDRRLIPGICFSIEPGIYLPGDMAVRTEINAFVTPTGNVVVAGEQQQELVRIEV